MARPGHSTAWLPLLVLLFASGATAQSCLSATFTSGRTFLKCNQLPALGASLHWTYHAENGTADIAFRATSGADGWVAWGINPGASRMAGSNVFVASQSGGAVSVLTTVLTSTSPALDNTTLQFDVPVPASAEYAGGAYTIYATVALPRNSTSQNTVWQAGPAAGGGISPHPLSGQNLQCVQNLDFLSGSSTGGSNSRLHRRNLHQGRSQASTGPRACFIATVFYSVKQCKKNATVNKGINPHAPGPGPPGLGPVSATELHGVLNAVGWGILIPLGAMIARYLRVFEAADPAWFYLHIACQISGYVLGVAGWGLGLKLGSESKGLTYSTHRNIGIAIFCLATLQVFPLFLRPDKKNKYRVYWNAYHHSVGYSVIVLAAVNIFKGLNILKPVTGWKTSYIVILATLAGVALVLEAITWAIVLRRRKRNKAHGGANGTGVQL